MSVSEIQFYNNVFFTIVGIVFVIWLVSVISGFMGKNKDVKKINKEGQHKNANPFWRMGEFAEKDDKQHGGGVWK
jgi:hypothetical protein